MKKIMGILVMAALAITSSASAAVSATTTNSVQNINFTLTFTSQLATNTTTVTKTTISGTGTHRMTNTVITTNVTYTVAHTSIGTKDVITSLLGGTNPPTGATLVRVKNDGNVTYEIRWGKGDTNRMAVSKLHINEVDSILAKASKTKDGNVVAGSGTDYSLDYFRLEATAGSPLKFRAVGSTETTWVNVTLGKYSETVDALTANLVGGGADSVGDKEIVTGTVTINGTVLKSEASTP